MNSMTGYGRGECTEGNLKIVAEMKAVNHRYSEIIIKQPRQYLALEEQIKKLIATQIKRGRIEVFIKAQTAGGTQTNVQLDMDKAVQYHRDLSQLAGRLGDTYQLVIYRLVTLPGVLVEAEEEEDLKDVWPVLKHALEEAIAQHMTMRQTEGERIRLDMLDKLQGLKKIVADISSHSGEVLEAYRLKLRTRIAELAEGVEIDEERLAQEVAYFAEKSCIDEELVRLSSHFAQFEEIVNAQGDVGRKLDFLVQEMNRETNTIGSKANDLTIARLVVEMKSELEKIREQVQNIE